MDLNSDEVKTIVSALDDLFYTLKAKMLGRFFTGPRLYFQVVESSDLNESMEGMFRNAIHTIWPDAKVDEHLIETLAIIGGDYLEAERLKTKNRLLNDLSQATTQKEINKVLSSNFNRAETYIEMLLNTETRIVQAHAERSGIQQVAASIGDDDPTVVMLGVVDKKVCHECRQMYHDPINPHKPIPYKLSQLKEGYFKRKLWDGKTPFISPLHPRCRHCISYCPKGYGFPDGGSIKFVSYDYDYYKDYYGIKKNELELLPVLTKTEQAPEIQDDFFDLEAGCSHDHCK